MPFGPPKLRSDRPRWKLAWPAIPKINIGPRNPLKPRAHFRGKRLFGSIFGPAAPFSRPPFAGFLGWGVGANPTLATRKIEAKGGPLPAFFHAHFAGEPPDPPQTAKTGGSLQNLPESPPKRQILGKKGGGVLPKNCLKVPPQPQNKALWPKNWANGGGGCPKVGFFSGREVDFLIGARAHHWF